MSIDYTWQKFFTALRIAIASKDSLQTRVRDAYLSGMFTLKAEDFPAEVRPEWEAFHAAIGKHGDVEETCKQMSDEEAQGWLEHLFDMYEPILEARTREDVSQEQSAARHRLN